jgi:hypothetical protein
MRILDYKTQKTMNDVGIFLSKEEAEELLAYLQRLVQSPAVQRVHLSEIVGSRLERELTVALDGEPHPLAVARTAWGPPAVALSAKGRRLAELAEHVLERLRRILERVALFLADRGLQDLHHPVASDLGRQRE